METAKAARRRIEVTAYDFSNERLNALIDDETVWIVQGSAGRRPIIAGTEDEAIDSYLDRFYEEPEEEFI